MRDSNRDRVRVIRAATGADSGCSYEILKGHLERLQIRMPALPEKMGSNHFTLLSEWPDEWWRKYVAEPVTGSSWAEADEIISRIDQARAALR